MSSGCEIVCSLAGSFDKPNARHRSRRGQERIPERSGDISWTKGQPNLYLHRSATLRGVGANVEAIKRGSLGTIFHSTDVIRFLDRSKPIGETDGAVV